MTAHKIDILHDDGTEEPGVSVVADAIPASQLAGVSAAARVDAGGDCALVIVGFPVADLSSLDPATVGAAVIAALESV